MRIPPHLLSTDGDELADAALPRFTDNAAVWARWHWEQVAPSCDVCPPHRGENTPHRAHHGSRKPRRRLQRVTPPWRRAALSGMAGG